MNLRGRVEKLVRILGTDDAELERLHIEQQQRRRAAVLKRFVRAIPHEYEDAAVPALEPHIDEYTHRRWVGREAHLLARMVDGLNWHGWFPNPLPAAWLDAVFANPTADNSRYCMVCGLPHPNGPTECRDAKTVYLPPHHPTCLYCGGECGYMGFYLRHQKRHPWGDADPGELLLAGADLDEFDPLRKQK